MLAVCVEASCCQIRSHMQHTYGCSDLQNISTQLGAFFSDFRNIDELLLQSKNVHYKACTVTHQSDIPMNKGFCQKMEHLYNTRDIRTIMQKIKAKPIIRPLDKI